MPAHNPAEALRYTQAEFDECGQIGERDGYEKAVQDIDRLTGGDGEYVYCLGHDSTRHCPDAEAMKARIVARFEALQASPPPSPDVAGVAERITTESDAEADMSLAKLDAITDMWAEEVNLTAMVKNAVSPMRLNRNAPTEVRERFTARMEAHIDALIRQAFLEGAMRVICGKEAPHDR